MKDGDIPLAIGMALLALTAFVAIIAGYWLFLTALRVFESLGWLN